MISLLYAAEGSAVSAAAPKSGIMNFMPLIVIFAIFYFLLIRPQQKKAKEHQQLLNNLNRGDKVVTSGGLYGTINALRGKVVEVKIADNVKVQVLRSAISSVVTNDSQSADEPKITDAEVIKK